MTNRSEKDFENIQTETKRKLHWLEIGYFTSQIGLAVIGIWALTIYHGQLITMQGQLDQMQGSSNQTDKLLWLYQKQLEQLTKQANDTHSLAVAARQQAATSYTTANATRSAANTARDTLHVSERAYIITGSPTLEPGYGNVSVPILNVGHIPSGKVIITVHEATIELTDPDQPPTPIPPTESHWTRYEEESIPATTASAYSVNIPLPGLKTDKFTSGRQQVVVVGTISFQDGFPDSKPLEWHFCDHSFFYTRTNQTQWAPCDWSLYNAQLIDVDHYPQNESK